MGKIDDATIESVIFANEWHRAYWERKEVGYSSDKDIAYLATLQAKKLVEIYRRYGADENQDDSSFYCY